MLKAVQKVRLLKSEGPARLARFGDFELDTEVNELRRGGLRVHLPEQAARVLTMLLARKDVVTLEELRQELWRDSLYGDHGHAIHNAVNRVRRALRDSAERPLFVETVPRRGYRFVAPVEWFSLEAGGEAVQAAPAERVPGRWRRALVVGGSLLGLAVGVTGGWRAFGPARESVCTHELPLAAGQVTMLRGVQGRILSVCHRPGSGGEWVVYRSGESGTEEQSVAYAGQAHVEHLAAVRDGVVAVFYHPDWRPWWEIRLSRDGELGGGEVVYRGTSRVEQVVPYRDGMLTVFRGTGGGEADGVYFSPDARDAGGGGQTRRIYGGPARVEAIQPFGAAVLTALYDEAAGEPRGVFLSPDGENLGGGGRTESSYAGPARVQVFAVTSWGVLTAFRGRSGRMSRVFLSPDGRMLGGGGRTRLVYGGWGEVEAMVPYRSGVITAFRAPDSGEALGVFYSPDCDHLAGGESTVSLVDGAARVSALAVVHDRILAAFENRTGGGVPGSFLQLTAGSARKGGD